MKLSQRIGVGVVLAAAVFGVGCNQTPKAAKQAFAEYHAGNYAGAADLLRPSAQKRDENYVLNNCRLGSAALAADRLVEAQGAFMNAYKVLNSVQINDPGRQMGTALVFEGVKVWKGEPFEQAMAHYYLAVTFLLQRDYDNARAAFENSLFKVREYAKKDNPDQYALAESRFALGYFGLGFCNMCMGKRDLAQANYALALKYDPRLAALIADVQHPQVNTLIFVDAGVGPRKAPRGWYNEESAFGPTPEQAGPVVPVVALLDGKAINSPRNAYDLVDTLAMAQQKMWQDIDTIKKVKAVVGTGMMAAGTGMTAYGAAKDEEGVMWAGIGTLAAGALLSASSQSDLRYWETLPRTVYIVPAILPPGPHKIEVEAGGSRSGVLEAVVVPSVPGKPVNNVYYFRLR